MKVRENVPLAEYERLGNENTRLRSALRAIERLSRGDSLKMAQALAERALAPRRSKP